MIRVLHLQGAGSWLRFCLKRICAACGSKGHDPEECKSKSKSSTRGGRINVVSPPLGSTSEDAAELHAGRNL